MYKEKPSRLFVRYALPQMAGLLLNSVYLIVDGIFIGNRLGRDAMAAAAVSVPVVEILIAIALAVSSGAGVLITNRLGRGEPKQANRIFMQSIWVLLGASVLIAVLGNVWIGPLATLLGATPDIHAQAVSYLWYIITFSPFLLFSFLLSGLVRCDDRPKLAMAALAVGSASNIVLDYVFLYPLNMGIAGAALATALGPVLSVAILLPHFLRKKGNLRFARAAAPLREAPKLLALGFPAFIMEFSIGIVTFLYNDAVVRNGYGEIGLAAYLMIGYLALMILTVFLGIAQGLQPLFGYYSGTGDVPRSRALLAFATKAVLAIGAGCYLAVLAGSRGFFGIFAPGDMELVAFAQSIALPYFSGFVFAGYNILMIAYWQSVQRLGSALWVSLSRSVILLPLLLAALPALMGAGTLWLGHSLAELLTAGFALALHLYGRRRRVALPNGGNVYEAKKA